MEHEYYHLGSGNDDDPLPRGLRPPPTGAIQRSGPSDVPSEGSRAGIIEKALRLCARYGIALKEGSRPEAQNEDPGGQ